MGVPCTKYDRRLDDRPLSTLQVHSLPTPVTLHVYNVGTSATLSMVNSLLQPLGTGLFHCGVELYDWEWSYSFGSSSSSLADLSSTGVFCCRPKQCEGHQYCMSLNMGTTCICEDNLLKLISKIEPEWPMGAYDILKRNCCHFCNDFCRRLGVGSLPRWVSNMADAGAAMERVSDMQWCCQCQEAGVRQCCITEEGTVVSTPGGYPFHRDIDDIIVDPVRVSQQPDRRLP